MGRSVLDRREPESSLATKIILLVFVATFVSAALVSWISIEMARRQLWSQVRASFPALLERSGQHVLRRLAEGRSLTADLASRPASRDTLLALARDAGTPARREPARVLFTSLAGPPAARSREISAFVLLDREGRPVFETPGAPALSPPERIALAHPEPPLVHDFARAGRRPVIATSVAVRSPDGSPHAYLVGFFRTETLRDALLVDRPDPQTRIALFDDEGRSLVFAGLPDEAEPGLPPPSVVLPGAVAEYTSGAGRSVVGAVRPLGTLGFTLLVEAPYEHVFAPVFAMLRRLLLIDACIVALASLLAYVITASIVRPIEALSEGARRIAAGRLDLSLPETGREDELGLLTRTFNEMVRRIGESQAAIETANRRLRSQNENLQASNEVLEQLSITDGLTKLHNHRFFQDHLTREIKRASRTTEPLTMILVDIDDFKRLNDRLGHAAGDELLQRIARALSESVRESDLLARYGGEEFVVLASGTDLAGGTILAEKLRLGVAERPFPLEDAVRPVTVTVSVGVAQYRGDRKKFFQAADRALYRAKADGKDCVRVEE